MDLLCGKKSLIFPNKLNFLEYLKNCYDDGNIKPVNIYINKIRGTFLKDFNNYLNDYKNPDMISNCKISLNNLLKSEEFITDKISNDTTHY